MVIPTDTYKFVYTPDTLTGILDSVVLDNEVVAGDRVIDVKILYENLTDVLKYFCVCRARVYCNHDWRFSATISFSDSAE